MKEELNKMLQQAMEEIEKAGDLEVIETLRVKYLGKKSKMSEILRGMGKLSHEDRRLMGEAANSVRDNIASVISSKKKLLKEADKNAKGKDRCYPAREGYAPWHKASNYNNHRRDYGRV